MSVLTCSGLTADETRETVRGCPCSAETTEGTAAWRAGMVRVTRLAQEQPVSGEAEDMLRALAAGERVEDDGVLFPQLKARGLADLVDLLPALTVLGGAYLAVRDGEPSAQVDPSERRRETPVSVVLGLITARTGPKGTLPSPQTPRRDGGSGE